MESSGRAILPSIRCILGLARVVLWMVDCRLRLEKALVFVVRGARHPWHPDWWRRESVPLYFHGTSRDETINDWKMMLVESHCYVWKKRCRRIGGNERMNHHNIQFQKATSRANKQARKGFAIDRVVRGCKYVVRKNKKEHPEVQSTIIPEFTSHSDPLNIQFHPLKHPIPPIKHPIPKEVHSTTKPTKYSALAGIYIPLHPLNIQFRPLNIQFQKKYNPLLNLRSTVH